MHYLPERHELLKSVQALHDTIDAEGIEATSDYIIVLTEALGHVVRTVEFVGKMEGVDDVDLDSMYLHFQYFAEGLQRFERHIQDIEAREAARKL